MNSHPQAHLSKGALSGLDMPDLQREIGGNVNMIKGESLPFSKGGFVGM